MLAAFSRELEVSQQKQDDQHDYNSSNDTTADIHIGHSFRIANDRSFASRVDTRGTRSVPSCSKSRATGPADHVSPAASRNGCKGVRVAPTETTN